MALLIEINPILRKLAALKGAPISPHFGAISFFPRHNFKDSLFLCLKHQEWDGFEYVPTALQFGAIGIVVEQVDFNRLINIPENIPVYVVESMKNFMLALAVEFRAAYKGRAIAVTGSAGKSHTVELLTQLLSLRFRCQTNEQNRNNWIGICDLMFSINKTTEVLVVELGGRLIGEIKALTELCRPDTVLITNALHAHLNTLGDLDNVMTMKSEILSVPSVKKAFVPKALMDKIKLPAGLGINAIPEKLDWDFEKLSGPHMKSVFNSVHCLAADSGLTDTEIHNFFKSDFKRPLYSLDILRDKQGRRFLNDGRTNSLESVLNFLDALKIHLPVVELLILAGTSDLGLEADKEFIPVIVDRFAEIKIKKVIYLGSEPELFKKTLAARNGFTEFVSCDFDAEAIYRHIENLPVTSEYAIQGLMQLWYYTLLAKIIT